MKAALFDRFGEPAEVLQARDVPLPEPGPGQVRVRMLASPINPSDLLTARGLYGHKPQLPAIPGYEGVGVVEKAGPGWLGWLRLGKRVAVLNPRGGNWAEFAVVPARNVVPVPADVPDAQAASFFVNPASVLAMVHGVLRVPRGEWLLQTAAGSALGRMVIKLGKHAGFRTINVVRRREQAEQLRQFGGDAVICTADESMESRVRDITGGGVRYAIDAVGGAAGSEVIRALAPRGRLLVYGVLSGEPLVVPPRSLIWGSKMVEGFYLTEWSQAQSVLTMLRLFRQIGQYLLNGVLTTEVGPTFPLDDIQAAARAADQPGKAGKVLLRIANS